VDIVVIARRTQAIEAGQRADPSVIWVRKPQRGRHDKTIALDWMTDHVPGEVDAFRRQHWQPLLQTGSAPEQSRRNPWMEREVIAVIGKRSQARSEVGSNTDGIKERIQLRQHGEELGRKKHSAKGEGEVAKSEDQWFMC
jgi:hypothetical protein